MQLPTENTCILTEIDDDGTLTSWEENMMLFNIMSGESGCFWVSWHNLAAKAWHIYTTSYVHGVQDKIWSARAT